MTLDTFISDLRSHAQKYSLEAHACSVTTEWIKKHEEFAFVKDNLEGHIVASMLIMNPSRTKALLILHKKFNRWQQFGGHCDGEIDVYNVALREFHEESGIEVDPENLGLLYVDEQFISENNGRPEHTHYDI
jgi:8-oxo-dGTP pyrophosphatase MutT (NUDIX family)